MPKILQFVSLTMHRFLLYFPLFILLCPTLGKGQSQNSILQVYSKLDLGLTDRGDSFCIKVWAPLADSVEVLLMKEKEFLRPHNFYLKRGDEGEWKFQFHKENDYNYYLLRTKNHVNGSGGMWSKWVTDPYSIAVSENGSYSAIIELESTNPLGWEKDYSIRQSNTNSIVIYELNIRDASMHATSGIQKKGKYLGLTEIGTTNNEGLSTGLDHIQELGVTHVHLLPFFDFKSSDESMATPPYNWGYDPFHYNSPEGIYASSNKDPATRIIELKKMVQSFHAKGLKVVMDVVYNHTALSENSSFEQLVPGYYYRKNNDGFFSNASACGNETASEKPMVRNFMLQSLKHWLTEYHIDGFRFDLMGIHDIATMNTIADTLRAINPSILLYGEGWTAGASTLPDIERALKENVNQLHSIAVFGDEFRDGLKGSVFEPTQKGYLSGIGSDINSILFGLVGGIAHPAINYEKVRYTKKPLTKNPQQLIAYADCHDNHTLRDKLQISNPNYSLQQIKELQKLAYTLILTSQSPTFIHAGSEFMRTKKGVENSFESPDSINAIDWEMKTIHADLVDYVKKMIQMKKNHSAFHLSDPARQVQFFVDSSTRLIGYFMDAIETADNWKKVQVWFNPSDKPLQIVPYAHVEKKGMALHIVMKNQSFLRAPVKVGAKEKLFIQPHSSIIMAAW
jgi:pullulanase